MNGGTWLYFYDSSLQLCWLSNVGSSRFKKTFSYDIYDLQKHDEILLCEQIETFNFPLLLNHPDSETISEHSFLHGNCGCFHKFSKHLFSLSQDTAGNIGYLAKAFT